MVFKRCIRVLMLTVVLSCMMVVTALAANRTIANKLESPVNLVVDSDYITGKVNDPVSRKTKTAFIVRDNAAFHLESTSMESTDVIFYINSFVEGQDMGIHNRVQKKLAKIGEDLTMLPEDVYESCTADGTGYDFLNRCYDIRVYLDPDGKRYEDYYFGLVDDQTYEQMKAEYERVQEELQALKISAQLHP